MEFNKTVCDSFFDFSRELNESDGIIQTIYSVMHKMQMKHKGLFQGMEKRLTRACHHCRDAENFMQLAKTSFRNQKIRNNDRMAYLGLLFFTGGWINDQARLLIEDAKLPAITDHLSASMASILTNDLNFRSRADWYELVTTDSKAALENDDDDTEIVFPFLAGVAITALINYLK